MKTTIEQKITKLLCQLIETKSLSKEEQDAKQLLVKFFKKEKIPYETKLNNIWVKNKHFNFLKPTILLNSHIDTVKPVNGWTKEPYQAIFEEDKLIGLGVNDAGAALVCVFAPEAPQP